MQIKDKQKSSLSSYQWKRYLSRRWSHGTHKILDWTLLWKTWSNEQANRGNWYVGGDTWESLTSTLTTALTTIGNTIELVRESITGGEHVNMPTAIYLWFPGKTDKPDSKDSRQAPRKRHYWRYSNSLSCDVCCPSACVVGLDALAARHEKHHHSDCGDLETFAVPEEHLPHSSTKPIKSNTLKNLVLNLRTNEIFAYQRIKAKLADVTTRL